jgi:hypothetical protein
MNPKKRKEVRKFKLWQIKLNLPKNAQLAKKKYLLGRRSVPIARLT